MNKTLLKKEYNDDLMTICSAKSVNYKSMMVLIEAENSKKLSRANNYIQQAIDTEIDKAIQNEDK